MTNIQRRISRWVLLLLMANCSVLFAQEVDNVLKYRSGIELKFGSWEKVDLSIAPELRLDDAFTKDEFIIEAGIDYSPIEILSFEAVYRFVANYRSTRETEINHKHAFGVALTKDVARWTPSLKVRYTNFSDDDIFDKKFLRYKVGTKYDIKGCKATPFVATEIFHQLSDASIQKMRYSGGVSYKLFKNNYVKLSYKLDYYVNEYENRHIFSVGYKIKL